MYRSYLAAFVEGLSPAALTSKCPHKGAGSIYCSASVMRLAISKRQDSVYCSTDNFDCCPVYLGKALRGTRVKPLP